MLFTPNDYVLKNPLHFGILLSYFHTVEISNTEHLSLMWWISV